MALQSSVFADSGDGTLATFLYDDVSGAVAEMLIISSPGSTPMNAQIYPYDSSGPYSVPTDAGDCRLDLTGAELFASLPFGGPGNFNAQAGT